MKKTNEIASKFKTKLAQPLIVEKDIVSSGIIEYMGSASEPDVGIIIENIKTLNDSRVDMIKYIGELEKRLAYLENDEQIKYQDEALEEGPIEPDMIDQDM